MEELWTDISKEALSYEFICKYADKLDWSILSTNKNIPDIAFREHMDKVDIDAISEHIILSDEFIREYADNLDWYIICEHQQLSEDIMREFADKVDWSAICEYQKLSEEFMREFADKLDWYMISERQQMSVEFICEFGDQIEWECLDETIKYKAPAVSVLLKYHDKINWDWLFCRFRLPDHTLFLFFEVMDPIILLTNQSVPEKFVEKYIPLLDEDDIFDMLDHQKLSEPLLRKYAHLLDSAVLSVQIATTQIMPENFIRDFQDKVDWNCVSVYQTLSNAFIYEFRDKVEWDQVWENQNVSYQMIQDFKPKRPTKKIRHAIQQHHCFIAMKLILPLDIAALISEYY